MGPDIVILVFWVFSFKPTFSFSSFTFHNRLFSSSSLSAIWVAIMTIIKMSTNNKCQKGRGQKRTLLHWGWEYKLIQLLWKTIWRFLKKLGVNPQYDPAIPPLRINLRKPKLKNTHVSQCSLQHYLQLVEHGSNLDVLQQMMDKEAMMHVYNGILLSHRQEFTWVCSNEVDEPKAYYNIVR